MSRKMIKCDICLQYFNENLAKECETKKYNVCDQCCINDCCDKCETIVIMRKQFEELKEKLRWIPVSERLPEKNGFFEIQLNDDYVATRFLNTDEIDIWIRNGVKAWREIPELEDGE